MFKALRSAAISPGRKLSVFLVIVLVGTVLVHRQVKNIPEETELILNIVEYASFVLLLIVHLLNIVTEKKKGK